MKRYGKYGNSIKKNLKGRKLLYLLSARAD
jgi:hypothetical protein